MIIVDDRATKDILQYVLQAWFGECKGQPPKQSTVE